MLVVVRVGGLPRPGKVFSVSNRSPRSLCARTGIALGPCPVLLAYLVSLSCVCRAQKLDRQTREPQGTGGRYALVKAAEKQEDRAGPPGRLVWLDTGSVSHFPNRRERPEPVAVQLRRLAEPAGPCRGG